MERKHNQKDAEKQEIKEQSVLVVEDNTIYEIDLECYQKLQNERKKY